MAAPCDLNIRYTDKSKLLENTLDTATKLGYEAVALNYIIEDLLKCDKKKKKKQSVEEVIEIKKPSQILADIKGKRSKLELFSRFSTSIDTIDQTYRIQRSDVIQSFDLVAVNPTSEKTMQQACLNLDIDIISLNLAEQLDFPIRRQQVNAALDRGIFFEICYSPVLTDNTSRRNTIAKAIDLVKVCKGKNIIISSFGEKPLDLRGALDVANLGEVFGLNKVQQKAAVTTNCKAAIQHGRSRKNSNSIISIRKSSDLTPAQQMNLKELRSLNAEIELEEAAPPVKKFKRK